MIFWAEFENLSKIEEFADEAWCQSVVSHLISAVFGPSFSVIVHPAHTSQNAERRSDVKNCP